MPLIIRQGYAPDLSGVLECLAALAPVNLTVEEAIKVYQLQLKRGVRLYVADDGKQVVGTASLVLEPKLIHGGRMAARIEEVAVRTSHQRQGVGTALVKRLLDDARNIGAYKVVLCCKRELVEWYRSRGFWDHEVEMRAEGVP